VDEAKFDRQVSDCLTKSNVLYIHLCAYLDGGFSVVTFHVVLEPIIILAMGYLSYILADMFDFSGIVR